MQHLIGVTWREARMAGRRLARGWAALGLIAVVFLAPRAAPAQEPGGRAGMAPRRPGALAPRVEYGADNDDVLLNETFRIDLRTIDVRFDYYPDRNAVDAVAHLEFTMRPGQSVPRFHFPPGARTPSTVQALVLDGESLSFGAPAVTVVAVSGSSQSIIQIDRRLDEGRVHTLDMAYRLLLPTGYPRFSSEVNDMAGHGNEERFPTLNTPHELARHRLALRVHGPRPFRCIGSGLVERRDDGDADVQQWLLDTEREVASYTVMFALLPADDTDLQERVIHGIPVRILAFRNGPSIDAAFVSLGDWLPRLEAAFGLYPAPRGLSVFLVSQGGGMEYFGGTISTPSALTHEVLHNYFACAVVTKTYRDSWLDEAITEWFNDVAHGARYAALDASYEANWVGARSPASVGYSVLAYTDGAQIMQSMADRLGGTDRMTAFLRYVYERHAFAPFTTTDFVSYFRDFSGIDLQASFEQWLYHPVSRLP